MEVFSTLPRAALPWTANILTVVTLACATWWSAGQRPVAPNAPLFATSTSVASARDNPASKDQADGRQVVARDVGAAAAEPAPHSRGPVTGHGIAGYAVSALPGTTVQPVAFLPSAAR